MDTFHRYRPKPTPRSKRVAALASGQDSAADGAGWRRRPRAERAHEGVWVPGYVPKRRVPGPRYL